MSSIIELPRGIFTQGSIQVRNSGGFEPKVLGHMINPFAPYGLRIDMMQLNSADGYYTISGIGVIGGSIELFDNPTIDSNDDPITPPTNTYPINEYGHFSFDLPYTIDDDSIFDNLWIRMVDDPQNSNLKSNLIQLTQPTATFEYVIIADSDNIVGARINNSLVEFSEDGGETWRIEQGSAPLEVELSNGIYTSGTIRVRPVRSTSPTTYEVIGPTFSREGTISPYVPQGFMIRHFDGLPTRPSVPTNFNPPFQVFSLDVGVTSIQFDYWAISGTGDINSKIEILNQSQVVVEDGEDTVNEYGDFFIAVKDGVVSIYGNFFIRMTSAYNPSLTSTTQFPVPNRSNPYSTYQLDGSDPPRPQVESEDPRPLRYSTNGGYTWKVMS
jgi:hypothetical protein